MSAQKKREATKRIFVCLGHEGDAKNEQVIVEVSHIKPKKLRRFLAYHDKTVEVRLEAQSERGAQEGAR